jgi:hypothetical protein
MNICSAEKEVCVGTEKTTKMMLLLLISGLLFTASRPVSAANLDILRDNRAPARLASGPEGNIYVTDPDVGSVFIYDADLNLTGELKNLNIPLGIAVGVDGTIYVGCQGIRAVQAYDRNGDFIMNIGQGELAKPNDIALDLYGNLYVADSPAHRIRIYNMEGRHLGDIGSSGQEDGEFNFPAAVDIAYYTNDAGQAVGELFVVDQGNDRFQVFDLNGRLLRVLSPGKIGDTGGWFGVDLQEDEVSTLQSIAIDDQYRMHSLDVRLCRIQVWDAVSGVFIETYGSYGTGTGFLNLPLDLAITDPVNGTNRVVVVNNSDGRVETINEIATLGDIQLAASPVAENVPTGTTVGTFSLTPAPAGPATFKLVEETWPYDNAFFEINSGTNLVTARSLDYEQLTNMQIRVKAIGTDAQNLTLAQTLELPIMDANEPPTDFGLTSWYILEGQPSNTLVGTFAAIDEDAGDVMTYSLVAGEGDSGNIYFDINGANLIALTPFDHSVTNRYSIRARAADSGGLSLTYIFYIDVYPTNSVGEADLDGDGISDWWEADFDLYVTDFNPEEDSDGDGISNRDEWIANTNPLDPDAFFKIEDSSVEEGGANFVLYWRSRENRSYSVYWRTNLTESFQLLTNGITGTPPWNSYTDTVSSADEQMFYRLRVELAQ